MKADTLERYLGLAKRLQDADIRALTIKWEALEGRAALLDALTTLRQIFVAALDNVDLLHVLQHFSSKAVQAPQALQYVEQSNKQPRAHCESHLAEAFLVLPFEG